MTDVPVTRDFCLALELRRPTNNPLLPDTFGSDSTPQGDGPQSTLLSTWIVIGVLALGEAFFLDQAVGATRVRAVSSTVHNHSLGLVYAARFGLSPVMVAVGLAASAWLLRTGRRHSAAALCTAALVALLFSARSFAVADMIGWRAALFTAATAGRTTATTTIAMVFAGVAVRERLTNRMAATAIGVGFPLAIGATRAILGVYPIEAVAMQWLIGAAMAAAILWA